jgi:hypothetical protein
MGVIQRTVRRYSLVDSGGLTRLFRSPEIFRSCGDDFSDISKLGNFIENNLRAPYVYVMGIDPRHEAFIFIPSHTTSCYVAHFCVRSGYRGREAKEHLILAAKYVFENTPCRAIMGYIRASNKPARMLASTVGMKRIGRTRKTLMFGGEMVDEVIYQCTIEDYNEKYGEIYGRVNNDRIGIPIMMQR